MQQLALILGLLLAAVVTSEARGVDPGLRPPIVSCSGGVD